MATLFHHDLVVVTLASGSKGNCTYVGDGRRGLLIDCGISTKQVLARLDAVGLGDAPIDAVLITHEHADHVAAAAILDRRLEKRRGTPVPFWMTAGTARQLSPKVRPRDIREVRAGSTVAWEGWTLEPHAVPHDTPDPVAWAVEVDGVRAGVITDLGHPTRLVGRLLASLDVAVVEFNHDVPMLMDGPYPWALKQRIRSRHGHMSNAQAADLVARAASSRLQHLVLAHLSDENNAPAIALAAADAALREAGRHDVVVQLGEQRTPVDPIRITPAPTPVAPGVRRPRTAQRSASDPTPSPRQVALFGE